MLNGRLDNFLLEIKSYIFVYFVYNNQPVVKSFAVTENVFLKNAVILNLVFIFVFKRELVSFRELLFMIYMEIKYNLILLYIR